MVNLNNLLVVGAVLALTALVVKKTSSSSQESAASPSNTAQSPSNGIRGLTATIDQIFNLPGTQDILKQTPGTTINKIVDEPGRYAYVTYTPPGSPESFVRAVKKTTASGGANQVAYGSLSHPTGFASQTAAWSWINTYSAQQKQMASRSGLHGVALSDFENNLIRGLGPGKGQKWDSSLGWWK